jgi:D-alanyl-D-alanine carboxypeptidase/D-alanyl-D-alanine-endopeptidase (penicillin-binding protein 4)
MRLVAVVWLVGCGALGVAQDRASLDRLVAQAEALGTRTGVAVANQDGRSLYAHRSHDAFAPASNMKLLTAAAVLQGLGADFTFATSFRHRHGELVVTASGDPNWIHDTPHDAAHVFAAVARALRASGVEVLRGIQLDPGVFLGPLRPATWPADQLQTYYCAPTGPFVLEQGTFLLRLAPGGDGRARVELAAPYADVALRGSIELVDRAKDAVYGATDRGDAVAVRGRFPRRGNPVTIKTAVADPSAWYRAALAKALQEAGIRLDGSAPAAAADQLVYTHKSDLRLAILRMLEDSSNFDAEQCLRVLGAVRRQDGSLSGGLAALGDLLTQQVGGLPADVVLADGSGLSKQNRLTPALLLTAMLRAAAAPGGAVLRACLPVAGQSGTLAERFHGTELVGRVRAKTGWIRGASALSGMVEGKDGTVRWFAILMNYDPKQDGRNKDLKRLQEQIVQVIERMPVGA